MDGFISNGNDSAGVPDPDVLDHNTFVCGTTDGAGHLQANATPVDCSGDVGLFSDTCCSSIGVNNITLTNNYFPCGAGCGNQVCLNAGPKTFTNSFQNMIVTGNVFDVQNIAGAGTGCFNTANLYPTPSGTRPNNIWCNNRYTDGSVFGSQYTQC
jgi:hypothetical protein